MVVMQRNGNSDDPEVQDAFVRYWRWLPEHGIDMPDPGAEGPNADESTIRMRGRRPKRSAGRSSRRSWGRSSRRARRSRRRCGSRRWSSPSACATTASTCRTRSSAKTAVSRSIGMTAGNVSQLRMMRSSRPPPRRAAGPMAGSSRPLNRRVTDAGQVVDRDRGRRHRGRGDERGGDEHRRRLEHRTTTRCVTRAVETAIVERLISSSRITSTAVSGTGRVNVTGQGGGVITALPELGSAIRHGEPPWEVDGAPGPRLLFGDLPMWRELRNGVDDGADVPQLEENLMALGLAPEGLVVDEEFDTDTTAAIRAWQEAGASTRPGRRPRRCRHRAGGPRVAEQRGAVGDQVGPEILGLTPEAGRHTRPRTRTRSTRSRWAPPRRSSCRTTRGSAAPRNSATIGRHGSGRAGGGMTIEASPAHQTVSSARRSAGRRGGDDTESDRGAGRADPGVVALAEGGYAVERVSVPTQLVAVEPGAFGDGIVEITGDSPSATRSWRHRERRRACRRVQDLRWAASRPCAG